MKHNTHQHDALWADCGLLMQLGSRSRTLHYRAYADTLVTGESALAWASLRLAEVAPVAVGLTVMCDRGEIERLEKLSLPKSVAVLSATELGDIHDARLYAEHAGVSRVLVCDITAALLPKRALQLLIQHHIREQCDATLLLDTPCALAPCIVNRAFIDALPSKVGKAVSLRVALMMVAQSGARKASMTSAVQFVNAQGADAEASCWPFRTRLTECEDVAVLRRVVSLARSTGDDELLLRGWAPAIHATRRAAIDSARPAQYAGRLAVDAAGSKVLFTQAPSAFTGVEQVVVTLARYLNGVQDTPFRRAALLTLAGLLSDLLQETGVDVTIAERDFSVPSISNYRYATQVLRAISPSLVHAHSVVGVPLCTAIHDAGIPLVQHVHVADGPGLEQLEEQMAVAAAVIAVSEFVKNQIRRLGVDERKIHVIHNGTVKGASGPHRRTTTREHLGIPEGTPTVLIVARYAGNKRHDVSLDAYIRAQKRCPRLHLLIAGEAFAEGRALAEDIARIIHQSGLRDQVRNLGFWPDMTALYDAADVYMLTSERDPLPLTVLEAMAHGVPVVATNSGGIPEMIEDNVSGILAPPGQAQAFADGIERVLCDGTFRSALISGATARANQFSIQRFVTSVRAAYSSVLSCAIIDHQTTV